MTFFYSRRISSQYFVFFLLLASTMWISACGDGVSFRRNGAPANLDLVYQQVRAINPAELDRCRISTEPRPFSTSPSFSGGSSGNTSANAQARSGDAAAWSGAVNRAENEIGSKLFGDDGGPAASPAPSSNDRGFGSSTTTQPSIQITEARILSRDNINYAQIDIDPNSLNTATLYTRGFVRLDLQVPTSRRIQNVRRDSVLVDLTYSLSNSYRGWQCNQVYIDTRDILETPASSRRVNPGDRIGW